MDALAAGRLRGPSNFSEPDGYIDRCQSVHSGEDEAAGAPPRMQSGATAGANYQNTWMTGPDYNKAGGIQIGDRDF